MDNVLNPEVVQNQLAEVEKTSGIAENSAVTLRNEFAPFYLRIQEWCSKAVLVTKPDDSTHQKIARDVRLGLKSVRCDIEKARKTMKSESLARGKAIDGFANILKYPCETVEAQMLEVEQYAERKEAERLKALTEERTRLLVESGAEPTTIAAYNLAVMDESTFNAVLEGEKKKTADRAEAARKAEFDRVAREQADRIAREKAEKEAAEARAKAEQERKAREAIEAKARSEKAALEAKARAEREKAAKAMRKETEARQKAEYEAAEAKRREQQRLAEEKAEEDRKAKEAARAERAPDKVKILALAQAVRAIELPNVKNVSAKSVVETIGEKRDVFANWIEMMAERL